MIGLCVLAGCQSSSAEPRSSTLSAAIEKGDLEIVRRFVESGEVSGYIDDTGETALVLAVRYGQVEIADLLLRSGCDVNERDLEGFTPLYFAALTSSDEMSKLLLRSGADPNKGSLYEDENVPPLYDSIFNQRMGITTLLLIYGADLDAVMDMFRDMLAPDTYVYSDCFFITENWEILSQLIDREIAISPNEEIRGKITGGWSDFFEKYDFREDGTCLIPRNSEHPEVVGGWIYSSGILSQRMDCIPWSYQYLVLKVDAEKLEIINLDTLDITYLHRVAEE